MRTFLVTQQLQCCGGARLDRIGDGDHPARRAVQRQEQRRRAVVAQRVGGCLQVAQRDALRLHQRRVAQRHRVPIDRSAHALAGHRGEIGRAA